MALSPVRIAIRLLSGNIYSHFNIIFLLIRSVVVIVILHAVVVLLDVIILLIVLIIFAFFVLPFACFVVRFPGIIPSATWLDNDLCLLVFTIEFLLIKFITHVILVQDHVAVVECFHTLLVRSHIILNRFFHELFDNTNQDVGIKSAIVLLRLPEGSSLPI